MAKVVSFGEVMLRLSTPGYQRFSQARQFDATFGGGEANVAVSLANYGVDAHFVTRLPKNDIADMCTAELKGLGVNLDGVVYGGDRVGIYYLETGAVARGSKVVYDRAHSAISEIQPGMVDWHKVLEGADWFHWTGITPALSQGAADACLEAIKVANELGVKVSCDLNYRKKLWKYGKTAAEVMPALVEGCDLILGNEEDAEKEFGIKPEGFDAEKTGGEIERSRAADEKVPEVQESGHHPARLHQRQPQHLGRRSVRWQDPLAEPSVRHHPHRGPCGRRRFLHGRSPVRPHRLRYRPGSHRVRCGSLLPQAHHPGRLQPCYGL